MKHAHGTINIFYKLCKGMQVTAFFFGLFIMLQSCKKQAMEEIVSTPPPPPPQKTEWFLTSIHKNGVQRAKYVQNNLKQMSLAAHYNEMGIVQEQIAYEYDADGVLKFARMNNGDYYQYSRNAVGIILGYQFNPAGSSRPTRSGKYGWDSVAMLTSVHHYNQAGVLERSTHYTYNDNRTLSFGVEREMKESGEETSATKTIFEYQATPEQVMAWNKVAKRFPQPELPFDVLTMLCSRIVQQKSIGDDVWVDGKIITAQSMHFNNNGLMGGKVIVSTPDTKSDPIPTEILSFNYSRAVWN